MNIQQVIIETLKTGNELIILFDGSFDYNQAEGIFGLSVFADRGGQAKEGIKALYSHIKPLLNKNVDIWLNLDNDFKYSLVIRDIRK